jgi:Cu/Ag efflux protein CusF
MNRKRLATLVPLCLIVVAVGMQPGPSRLKSGLQSGERIPSAFDPVNVTGEHAGEPHCLVCENGLNPVAMIFAREVNEPLLGLVAKIDAATAKHRKAEMGSFVVFLSKEPDLDKKLKAAAKKIVLKHTVLSIMEEANGPEDYKVIPDAEVTVVLYKEHLVQANHAFRKGELNGPAVERILADLPKIVGKE